MSTLPTAAARRRRLVTRALPLTLVALVAFVLGAIAGAPGSPDREAAQRFADAWAGGEFAAMYRELNPASQRRIGLDDFVLAYREAAETATVRRLEFGSAGSESTSDGGSSVSVPATASTVAFGPVDDELDLPFADGGVDWDPDLVFPGLRSGEHLESELELAPRAPILAADGSPLAEGPAEARSHPLGSAAIDVTGEVGEAEESETEALARQGFPPDTPVGVSGLEQAFNPRLAGKPGGSLLAVSGARLDPRPRRIGTARRRAGEDDDRPRPAGSGGRGPGRPTGRHRRARRSQRRRPRPRRAGLLRSPAARLDLQDDHDGGGAGKGRRLARRRIRDHRRRQRRRPLHRKRQRRVLRRHLPRSVRRVVQRRLRPARPEDRQRRPGRDRGTVRLQLATDALRIQGRRPGRTARIDDPDRYRRRSRPRRQRDRPGRGAGHTAGDGERRADDRQRRRARADLDRRQPQAPPRGWARAGDVEEGRQAS